MILDKNKINTNKLKNIVLNIILNSSNDVNKPKINVIELFKKFKMHFSDQR